LGVRGIRLCFEKPELFEPQLRAIYRAAAAGPPKIMFPMIATLEDLRAAKAYAEQVRLQLGAAPVELGMMVKVPSTVQMAAEFAEEVDFFSIGTNDLTQYAPAIDRLHPTLAKQADALHPAVLACAAVRPQSGVHSRPVQSISRAGGSAVMPSHHTSPSGVSATLVKIVLLRIVVIALGLERSDVPGRGPCAS